MSVPVRYLAPLLLFIFLSTAPSRSEPIDERLSWPPVFERAYGNPEVVVREAPNSRAPRVTFVRPLAKVYVRVPAGYGCSDVDRALRSHFLEIAWEDFLDDDNLTFYEERLNVEELIPMDRHEFFRIGHCRLAGCSTGDRARDAWWKVRMDEPLNPSRDHLLAMTALVWDDPDKETFGHFSFVLRRRGGCPDGDLVFDFRAPWLLDRRPRFTEAPNFHNRLKLRTWKENLYDWIYTQTEFRNCHIRIQFVETCEEQVTLLRSFDGEQHAGNFRVLKKNCASLGLQTLNRIIPLDERIKGEHKIADLPFKTYENAIEKFGAIDLEEIFIENVTQEQGNEFTSKTALREARPSRGSSRGYSILQKIAVIN